MAGIHINTAGEPWLVEREKQSCLLIAQAAVTPNNGHII